MFSLESPQRGDSNEYTQYTISQYEKENNLKLSQIRNYEICSKGLKNEFEPAVVNEPSLKFYCISDLCHFSCKINHNISDDTINCHNDKYKNLRDSLG